MHAYLGFLEPCLDSGQWTGDTQHVSHCHCPAALCPQSIFLVRLNPHVMFINITCVWRPWSNTYSLHNALSTDDKVTTPVVLQPGRIISISIDLRIDLPGWRGSTGDIPPMAGLYWRIYYQIENPRIEELQWRTSTGGPLMAGNRVCEG